MGYSKSNKIIEKLLRLIREGNNEKVKSLSANLNIIYLIVLTKGMLVHYSVKYGNEQVTQYLLDRGYICDAQDLTGTTPLMIAVRKKDEVLIQSLLTAGADITLLDHNNKSVLHMTIEDYDLSPSIRRSILLQLTKKYSTSEEIAQKLIDAGCPLYQAAYLGNSKVLQCMLEQGHSIDSMNPYTKQTALHVAVSLEDVDSVKLLIKYGANASPLDGRGSTPLLYIYRYNKEHTDEKIELLQILLNLQVATTSCNLRGFFQISSFLMYGNYKAINLVLQMIPDFTVKDNYKEWNLLFYLAVNKNPGVIEELKLHIHKFDINTVDNTGLSPLYVAVIHNNVNMVRFLLSQGIEPNCVNSINGYTPLYCAYSKFDPKSEDITNQCIQLLLQYNADPQFIVTEETGKQITVFDAAIKTNSSNHLKPVIAHLAILEGLGILIKNISLNKINSDYQLKKYFKRCQKLLKKKISGTVTIFKLLTADERKMSRYSANRRLILKLRRLGHKQHLKFVYPYYYNTIKKRMLQGIQYKRSFDYLAEDICKMFKNLLDKRSIVIDKIIESLEDESLQQMFLNYRN